MPFIDSFKIFGSATKKHMLKLFGIHTVCTVTISVGKYWRWSIQVVMNVIDNKWIAREKVWYDNTSSVFPTGVLIHFLQDRCLCFILVGGGIVTPIFFPFSRLGYSFD